MHGSTECDYECTGADTSGDSAEIEICGGNDAMSVYEYAGSAITGERQ